MGQEIPEVIRNVRDARAYIPPRPKIYPALKSGYKVCGPDEAFLHMMSPVRLGIVKFIVSVDKDCTVAARAITGAGQVTHTFSLVAGMNELSVPELPAGVKVFIGVKDNTEPVEVWYGILYRMVPDAAS